MQKYSFYLTSLFIGIIYYFTLAPSVIQIDSGELAAVQNTLGIAHPTGYPLFTILGYLYIQIPLSSSKIFQLNVLALIWCVLGVYFFLKLAELMIPVFKHQPPLNQPRKKKKQTQIMKATDSPVLLKFFPIFASAWMLAFSKTFWLQSTSIEVYSLHVLLIILVSYFSIKAFLIEKDTVSPWITVAIALAFCFSNHMTTILILPGLIYLFMLKYRFQKPFWKNAFIMLLVFFPILILIYSYLPIRASQEPVLNWGDPINWENFFRHLSGKQYRVWLFSSTAVTTKNLHFFFQNLPLEFAWIGFMLGLFGFFISFVRHLRLGIFLSITFLITVLYSVNYDINDLDSYFLLAYIIFALWIGIGSDYLINSFANKRIFQNLAICVVGLAMAAEIMLNFPKVNQREIFVYEDYAKQALNSVPQNAVVLTYQWDNLISPAYYFQFVENYRRDVVVIDKLLLKRSWYFSQLEKSYPDVILKIEPQIKSFLIALQPFERGGNYNAALLEQLYRNIMTQLIQTNLTDRTVYLAPELIIEELRRGELKLPSGCHLVPDLFFFRVVTSEDYAPISNLELNIRFPKDDNIYTANIKKSIATMLTWRSLYELQNNQLPNAQTIVNLIRNKFPGFVLPEQLRTL